MINRKIHRNLLLILVVLLLAACSDNDIATALTDDDISTDVSSNDIGRIAITVDKNADTRLERDDVETTFNEGDYVGCIILQGGSFYANSRWKVGTFDDEQRLTVDKFWIASSDSTTLTETSAVQYTSETTYSSSNPIITYDSDGYTGTTSSTPVRLYFYYPYIDLTTAETNYIPSVTDDNETTTYLMGMATAESATTYEGLSTSTDNIDKYAWTQYPVFINTNQSAETSPTTTTDDDGNETTTTETTAYKQDYSDFLWAAYTDGITNTDAGTLALTFKKKTATIEVSSGVELSDVKIVPVMNGMASGTTGNLIIGRYINLQTGNDTITATTDEETGTTTYNYPKNYNLTSNDGSITPYSYKSSDAYNSNIYNYRFLIPPQEAGYSAIQYTYNSATKEIELSKLASTIEEGAYYSVDFDIKKTYTYTGSVDSAYFENKQLNATSTTVFAIGCDADSYTPNYNGQLSSSSTATINGRIYTGDLKLQNTEQTYITVKPVSNDATVTFYIGYQNSSTPKCTLYYRSSDDDEYETYGTLNSFTAVESANYMYQSFEAENGKTYKIKRSSGTVNAILVMVEYHE